VVEEGCDGGDGGVGGGSGAAMAATAVFGAAIDLSPSLASC